MARAEAPRLDERRELRVAPLVRQPDARPRLGRQRHALAEHPLVLLERQVAEPELAAGAELGLDLDDARLDRVVAQRPRDRHPVVAVLDEVQLADAVHVDRRHRLAAPARRGDALPASAQLRRHGPELAVELADAPVDAADDRVERDRLHAEVVLGAAPERRDDLLEREHRRDVVGLVAQAGGDAREGAAPALAGEGRLRVLLRESGAHPPRPSQPQEHALARGEHEPAEVDGPVPAVGIGGQEQRRGAGQAGGQVDRHGSRRRS